MVVARTPFARTHLARQFKERTVRKTYVAIVRGILAHDRRTITRPLGRHATDRKRISVRSRHLRDAVSHLLVLHRFADDSPATLLRVRPETGRSIRFACISPPPVIHASAIRFTVTALRINQTSHARRCMRWRWKSTIRAALRGFPSMLRYPTTSSAFSARVAFVPNPH
jgi:23S rRNA pseudouridine1911/1915/1917 synthase